MGKIVIVGVIVGLLAVVSVAGAAEFDFYVLALSWSPDYCADDDNQETQQCQIGRRLGFVLHGLWPQYNQGYPSDCADTRLPQDVKAKFPGLYPNPSLFDHEWEKHGTCSGLKPEQYLSLSKRIKEAAVIPAAYRNPEKPFRVTTVQLKQAFVTSNPGLSESMIAAYCSGSGRFLKEIYICFTPDGKPTSCSQEINKRAARSCQQSDFLVRNVR
jgi:ribonuclease T2